jgi:alkaline phosphatase
LIVTGDHETGGLTVEDDGRPNAKGRDGAASEDDAGGDENGPFAVADSDREFRLDWSTGGHTSAPTPVSAEGPDSEQLSGSYPNTHLHEVMRAILVD